MKQSFEDYIESLGFEAPKKNVAGATASSICLKNRLILEVDPSNSSDTIDIDILHPDYFRFATVAIEIPQLFEAGLPKFSQRKNFSGAIFVGAPERKTDGKDFLIVGAYLVEEKFSRFLCELDRASEDFIEFRDHLFIGDARFQLTSFEDIWVFLFLSLKREQTVEDLLSDLYSERYASFREINKSTNYVKLWETGRPALRLLAERFGDLIC